MIKLKNRFFMTVIGQLLFCTSQAQVVNPDNADVMRSNGKIYVVVAVCLTILMGLFLYVFLIDRKIRRMEKKEGER
jgi:heme/copper-type cytochrome/quinol oxidase subunit 2